MTEIAEENRDDGTSGAPDSNSTLMSGNLVAAKKSPLHRINELAELRGSYISLSGSFAALEDALKTTRDALSEKRRELADVTFRYSRERQRLAQVQDEIVGLRVERDAAENDKRTVEQELARLSEIVAAHQRTVAELGRLRNDLLAERHRSARALDRADQGSRRVEALEATVAELEQTLRRREQQLTIAHNPSPKHRWRRSGVVKLGSQLRRIFRGRRVNPLFDSDWYMQEYADVRKAGVAPYRHYLKFGAKEGRNPNPLFDTNWYLARNPDVALAGVNPLKHFYEHGAAEGRDPHPHFSMASYAQSFPDKKTDGRNLGSYWKNA